MFKFVCLIVLIGNTRCIKGSHWGYASESPNGVVLGPENWGGDCDSGRRQSPVDLTFRAAIKGKYPAFKFIDYEESIQNAELTNTGHSIQINALPSMERIITGGGLQGDYVFDQMHFHWASEHTINGERYALELHMVHHNKKYESISEALNHKNGIAVLGILFHISNDTNPHLENILNIANDIKDIVGGRTKLAEPFELQNLLPQKKEKYFRYEGSLTTPNCGESVVWSVFNDSLPISVEQLERFKNIKTEEGHQLTHNYRTLQPLNSRALVFISTVDDFYPENRGFIISLAITNAIFVFLVHLFWH